jgi:hypothetical protein
MKANRWSVMHRVPIYTSLIMCLLLISFGCAAPSPSTGQSPPPPPTKLEVTSLSVTPIVASPGQAVTVEVKVRNAGGTKGTHTLALTINGVKEDTKDVIVAPGATETVAFTLARDASDMYDIEVAGLTETLKIKQPGAYPRLANLYTGPNSFFWKWQQVHPSEQEQKVLLNSLARWDIIVVHYDVVRTAPESLRFIKKQNPNAKILAYIEAGTGGWWHWLLTHDLEAQGKPTWVTPSYIRFMRLHAQYFGIALEDSNESFFLHYGNTPGNIKPSEKRRVIGWTNGTTGEQWPVMNPASEWSVYLPHFVHDKLMSSGLLDGVFYDCFWESMWESNIDIDNDGVGDSLAVVNREYRKGMAQLLKLTREILGPEAIILGNPGVEWSANSPYWDYANGHMQECALGGETWSSRDFSKVWDIYQRNMQKPEPPSRINWIGVDTNDVQFDPFNPNLPAADLQRMRYGLAITLLDDGYFGFDMGNDFHGELWWFPEYDANLGSPKGNAQKRGDGSWMREFENGMVVANPSSNKSTIEFTATYKDITTGVEGTSFVVSPLDGRIFVKSE